MEVGAVPRPGAYAKAAFSTLVPGGQTVTLRPMFGTRGAFVNGNMFAGLFGEDLFVRLPVDESAKVRKEGGKDFAPMAGHPMNGYVTVPGTWRTKPAAVRVWIATALEVTGHMTAKVPTPRTARVNKAAKR